MRQPQRVQTQDQVTKKILIVILALILLAPVGIILMYLMTDWSSGTKRKVSIVALVWFILALIFGQSNQSDSVMKGGASSTPVVQTETKVNKPSIKVNSAAIENDYLIIKTDKDDYTISLSTGAGIQQLNDESRSTVTINDNEIQSQPAGYDNFVQKFTLQPGDNTFSIVATNKAGKDEEKLIVRYEPKPVANTSSVDDPVFEAEITCQQHAEKQLLVKDVNLGYDQSSIKRKNPDGTILIKANIADSQGFWRQSKPLGIMECTTDPTGMSVISFINY